MVGPLKKDARHSLGYCDAAYATIILRSAVAYQGTPRRHTALVLREASLLGVRRISFVWVKVWEVLEELRDRRLCL